jgi:uncharacterized membrane protein YbhN (UPF0104 family)
MDIKFLLFSILLLAFAVLAVASNSIGIKCANQNASWKEGNKTNFQFLVSQLVSAILMVLCAFASIYMAIKAGGAVEEAVNGNM